MKSMIRNLLACLVSAVLFSGVAAADRTPAPENAYLYIGWPNDGEVVPANKPFRVWFGLRNMGVAPKGANVPKHRASSPVDRYRSAAAGPGNSV